MFLIEIKDADGHSLGYWREGVPAIGNKSPARIATIVEATRYTDKADAEVVAAVEAVNLTASRGEPITAELYQFSG